MTSIFKKAKGSNFDVADVAWVQSSFFKAVHRIKEYLNASAENSLAEFTRFLFLLLYNSFIDENVLNRAVDEGATPDDLMDKIKMTKMGGAFFERADRFRIGNELFLNLWKNFHEEYEFKSEHIELIASAYDGVLNDFLYGKGNCLRIPTNIAQAVIQMVAPKKGELICDPFCGVGRFLTAVIDQLGDDVRGSVYGAERMYDLVPLARMRMFLRKADMLNIDLRDGLSDTSHIFDGHFDVVVSVPGWGNRNEFIRTIYEESGIDERTTVKTSGADNLIRAIRLAKPGGRIALLLAENMLSSVLSIKVREYALSLADLVATFSVPQIALSPIGAKSSMCIVILRRRAVAGERRKECAVAAIRLAGVKSEKLQDEIANQIDELVKDFSKYREQCKLW